MQTKLQEAYPTLTVLPGHATALRVIAGLTAVGGRGGKERAVGRRDVSTVDGRRGAAVLGHALRVFSAPRPVRLARAAVRTCSDVMAKRVSVASLLA